MREWQHYDNVFVKAVFIDLLLSATAKPCWSCGIRLTRGQTLRSSRKIEEDNKISRPTVLRALRTLEDSGEIVREKISQKLVKTTIVNYSKYQDINFVSGKNETPQRLPQRLPQSLPLTTREQENKNDVVEINSAHAHEKIVNDMFATGIAIERFCMTEGITVDQCRELAGDVVAEWAVIGETHKTEKEVKKHILERIRKKVQSMRERGVLLGSIPEDVRLKRINADCEALIAEGAERKMVIKFYKYYTQKSNDGSGRMIFETLSGWDTKTRYVEFLNREKK